MPTVRLGLEYDGTGFAGWAKQRGERTVQHVVEAAAARILQAPVDLTVAGRTDRGVHAWGQVASFAAPRVPSARALNSMLPADVAVHSSEEAPDGFDARKDARSRTYCYRVLARQERSAIERERVLWWTRHIDRAALDAAGSLSEAAERGSHAKALVVQRLSLCPASSGLRRPRWSETGPPASWPRAMPTK